jgi:hypothetical protein
VDGVGGDNIFAAAAQFAPSVVLLAETDSHDDFKADEEVAVSATVDLDFWNLTKKN